MTKKYPFVRQSGLQDCAAASLSMIIKYYGGYIGLNHLNDMLKTTRNGTTAYHLVKVLNQLNFEANGYKVEIEDLSKYSTPFIANVLINKSYKHFIVVYEVYNDYLLIADPAKKIMKMKLSEFSNIYSGVIIVMRPIKPPPRFKHVSIYNFFKSMVISNKKYLILIFVLSLFVTVLSILTAFFLQLVLDNINHQNLSKLFSLFLFLMISKILIELWQGYILIKLNKKIDEELTLKIFADIINLPYNYYQGKTAGEVISRINDLGFVKNMISKCLVIFLIDAPLLILLSFVLFFLNPILFVVTSTSLVLYTLFFLLIRKRINDLVFFENFQKAEINSYMTEAIRGFETIKGLGIENKIITSFCNKYQKKVTSTYKLDIYYNKLYLFKELINVFSQFLLFVVGINLISNQVLTIGKFLTYIILFFAFSSSFRRLIDLDLDLKEAREAIIRILDLTYYQKPINFITKKIKGNIVINHLNFSIDDVHLILRDICLTINKGEKIMIYGPSGSGKSTLLKIIKKFYEVEKDKVKIDGIDINDYDKQTIDSSIVYVGQNEVLFTGTLLENLTLCDNNYQYSANLTLVNEIAGNNSLGYYALIEENGFNLSGGQRARIALARALHGFEIILIDEVFSEVDVSMERRIVKNLLKAYHDKTIIVVSHRIDNLDLFDRFIEIANGQIKTNVIKEE